MKGIKRHLQCKHCRGTGVQPETFGTPIPIGGLSRKDSRMLFNLCVKQNELLEKIDDYLKEQREKLIEEMKDISKQLLEAVND